MVHCHTEVSLQACILCIVYKKVDQHIKNQLVKGEGILRAVLGVYRWQIKILRVLRAVLGARVADSRRPSSLATS